MKRIMETKELAIFQRHRPVPVKLGKDNLLVMVNSKVSKLNPEMDHFAQCLVTHKFQKLNNA